MDIIEVLIKFYDSHGIVGATLISVLLLFFCRNVTVSISVGGKKKWIKRIKIKHNDYIK